MANPLRWAIAAIAAIVLLVGSLAPSQAASDLITITSARDLILPGAFVPDALQARPAQSMVISDKWLTPLIGRTMVGIFHRNGWEAGYHGWLSGRSDAGASFVTYDLYGFKTDLGALISRTAYHSIVVGTPEQAGVEGLPRSAVIWTDTGTFGPDHQPYSTAEIVFRVANVVGDVTGFYAGADATALESALHEAATTSIACAHWLSTRLPAHHKQSLLPVFPALLASGVAGRLRRR